MTEIQKRTIQAIVNVFETGRVLGDYGCVTAVAGDAGHLTYGRSQASLASGNLHRLIVAYCAAPEAGCAAALSPYLARLQARDCSLDSDEPLKAALAQAAQDPVMRRTQDSYFEGAFFEPAVKAAANCGLRTALGFAVVYDSFIQGGFQTIRKIVSGKAGLVSAAFPEERWIGEYVDARRKWLAAADGVLANSVYRMASFQELMSGGKWELPLPLCVRDVLIDSAALEGRSKRTLRLRLPRMTGDDVSELQRTLIARGAALSPTGDFDQSTDAAVRAFQLAHGLKPDGIVGPRTWVAVLSGQSDSRPS